MNNPDFNNESNSIQDSLQESTKNSDHFQSLLENHESQHLHILDNITQFNDTLQEYRLLEHTSLQNDSSSIRNHILLHLENQIDLIQENFQKICNKNFDVSIENNSEYQSKIKFDLENILGFSIDSYNQQTIIIENTIHKLSSEIEKLFNEIQKYIHHIHILEYKINFISNYEHILENQNISPFSKLVDEYESSIRNNLLNDSLNYIKSCTSQIHNKFNSIKFLQRNLYHKIITKYTCSICLHNNIDCYYTNCGHVICKNCGIKNRNHLCPFCKKDGSIKPLFFI
jgi:hypothetical protein